MFPSESNGTEGLDRNFRATRFMSMVTDHLPLSFWVPSYFMEPVFVETIAHQASEESAASAAVLAGHFMIWAGPATTMYQRNFIPDWTTAVFIQPLGLFEDVAVVLTAWAGSSPEDQRWAECSLYVFMMVMNITRYLGTRTDVW